MLGRSESEDIEPRNTAMSMADRVGFREGSIVGSVLVSYPRRTGVRDRGRASNGTGRNLGDPECS
jgi:hypothetical protein